MDDLIRQYPDDIFWGEATRRWQQKTLVTTNQHRAVIMGAMQGGQQPQQAPQQTQFDVICASCNKQTKVPFKPDPARQVFCYSCYRGVHND